MSLDYERVFRYAPGLFLLLRPDDAFTILDASDAYLQATLTQRDAIVGRPLFEAFPDNPVDPHSTGVTNLRASLLRVLATKARDEMPFQRYDVRVPESQGGGFTERAWSPTNAPVLSDTGEVVLIVHQVEDVTERARAERHLRANEILESITQGFFGLDREWRFTYVNREAERLLGCDADELVGQVLWERIPGLAGSGFEAAYRRTMDTRANSSVTAWYPEHDRWYEVHVYPAPDGVSIYFRDVTEQKRIEEERARIASESETQRRIYEAALSNTPDLVYVFDLDHRFVYANEALLTMWGRTREQALGRNCLELGYEPWHAAMHDREIEQVVATRAPIRGEVPFTGTGGRRIYDYIFVPVFGSDGRVVAVAGTTRDVTERQQAEQEIRAQAERLRAADHAKDEFLATLSHELRNPLAPLRSALELLRLGDGTPDSAGPIHAMMERQVDHLVRLVDDLLEMARISRGTLELRRERVQVADVVRHAVETSEPLVRSARHELTVELPEEPLWLVGDAVRLSQILANLLNNAAKYTEDGGRLRVGVRKAGDTVVIAVRDDGIGIPADVLPRIFEMFSRGDRSSGRRQSGLGIGLSLARRLAQMHGGGVEAQSDGPGKGSEFTLTLPLASGQPPEPAPDEKPAPGASTSRRRILVVDDNDDAVDALARMLTHLGAEVRIARSGPEALEAYGPFDPAIVVLDIGMPGMNGYEVAKRMRGQYPHRRTTIVALTGWGQTRDRQLALEAGFDHHLIKPAEISALEAVIATADDRAAKPRTADPLAPRT